MTHRAAAPVTAMADGKDMQQVEQLLDTPSLADALESDRFKQFLDHIPFAVAVAELHPSERLIYANTEFERLTRLSASAIYGKRWKDLLNSATGANNGRALSQAGTSDDEYIGKFVMEYRDATVSVDGQSNVIRDDDGKERFRLLALADVTHRDRSSEATLEQRLQEKVMLLRELQHRVKNNLQMVTALIRLEACNLPDNHTGEQFDRLAGRIDSLALLYGLSSADEPGDSVNLGVYLSQIASTLMKAHATEDTARLQERFGASGVEFTTRQTAPGMNKDVFNMSVRKFLKQVGITAQREIERGAGGALDV